MDVRLPSGQIIRGVPEGTSKDVIMQKAIAGGLATAEDFGQPAQPQTQQVQPQIQQPVQAQPQVEEPTLGDQISGGLEAAGAIAGGVIAEPVAGISGLLAGGATKIGQALGLTDSDPVDVAAQTIEFIRGLVPQPESEEGKKALSAVGKAVQGAIDVVNVPVSGLAALGELATGQGLEQAAKTVESVQEEGLGVTLGDRVLEETGSPELAAMAFTLPTAVLEAIGIKGAARLKPKGEATDLPSGQEAALSQASPEVSEIKDTARKLYQEIDATGAKIDKSDFLDFAIKAEDIAKKSGFDPELTPKSNALLKRIERDLDKDMTVTDVDQLRKVSQIAAGSFDNATDAAIGSKIIDELDDFLDKQGSKLAAQGGPDVGKKYRQARNLWSRAKKAEIIDEAMTKAENQASGFENGIRTQFRSILNNKKKRRGFTNDELAAMNKVVQGGTAENLFKTLGKLGFTEGQRTNVLSGLMGIGAGSAVGGPIGAVAVPVIGQVSMKLAQKLTRKNSSFAKDVVKAGKNGQEIVKAYLKNVPKNSRSTKELTELLINPDVKIDDIKAMGADRQMIRDAAFYAGKLRDASQAGLIVLPAVDQASTEKQKTQ